MLSNVPLHQHCITLPDLLQGWYSRHRALRIPSGADGRLPRPPQRRLYAPAPRQKRTTAGPPPACGARLRQPGAKGTGCRHCSPAGGRPLLAVNAHRRPKALPVGLGRVNPEQRNRLPALPLSARDRASPETYRSRPAPCLWGKPALIRSQRHRLPALQSRRRQAPARGSAAVFPLTAPFGTKRSKTAPCSWGGLA